MNSSGFNLIKSAIQLDKQNSWVGLLSHRHGFTLAEVLLALGIIGVVSAITIPGLAKNWQEFQYKSAFRKAYSVASQAWYQAVAENSGTFVDKGGASCIWADGTSGDFNADDGRTETIKSKMKVLKTCVGEKGCWADKYETYSTLLGNEITIGSYSPYDYSWITADGMCWANPWKGLDEVHLLVDTNCGKNPNKIGQDIFSMLLGADGVVYFYIDERSPSGAPVSKGLVCPISSDPATINGRGVSFRDMLYK